MKKYFLQKLKLFYITLRGNTLFFVSAPLWIAIIISIFQERVDKFAFISAALACFIYAGNLTKKFFHEQYRALSQNNTINKEKDKRFYAAILVIIGTALLTSFVFRRPLFITLASITAGIAYYLNYYSITQAEHTLNTVSDKVNATLREMVVKAYQDVNAIEQITKEIQFRLQDIVLAKKLDTLRNTAQHILSIIQENPDRIRAMRTFLLIYLPEIKTISARYLTHSPTTNKRDALLALLDSSIKVFNAQEITLTTQQETEWMIKMEVLREQFGVYSDIQSHNIS